MIGLAAVDHDPLGSAVSLERLAQETLGGHQIAPFAKPELDGVTVAVDGSIEIPPLPTHLDLGFIHVPPASDWALASIELLQQERSIVNGPAMDGGMVNGDSSLGHHLLEIPQTEIVGQVPTDAQQDH